LRNIDIFIKATKMLLLAQEGGLLAYTTMTDEEARRDLIACLIALERAKIFEIDEKIANLLKKTKSPVRPTRLPYPIVFLDTTLELENVYWVTLTSEGKIVEKVFSKVKYRGFLLIETADEIAPGYPNIIIFSIPQEEEGFGHLRMSLYKEYPKTTYRDRRQAKMWKRERDRIRNFIMSFLNFLHEPEIEIIEKPPREIVYKVGGIRRRISAPRKVVQVRGVLREYVRKLYKGKKFTYSHRFWVRGHWRHLKHPRFTHKRGQIIWIPPHIKGKGILIEKPYKLTRPYTTTVPKVVEPRKVLVKKKCPRCGLRLWLIIKGEQATLNCPTGHFRRKVKPGEVLT